MFIFRLLYADMTIAAQTFQLRPCIDADHDAIAGIWHSSASLPGVGPAVMPTVAALRKRLDEELAVGWNVTVAICLNEVAGFVAVRPRESVLAELFVRPGLLGQGIGRALLSDAKAKMPAGFSLYTRSTNVRARRFYEKEGLLVLREGTHPRNGDPITYYQWNSL